MLRIDGSFGEGGGQIVRTALALSALTGRPFEITNVRANRPVPGLRNQHVQCVMAAKAICSAEIEGAEKASRRLLFSPGGIVAGRHEIDIGTAGSTTLVLHTVFLPLSFAGGESHLAIRGGTHNGFCPIYDYLDLLWAPFMRRLGFDVAISLNSAGYYPKGGGEIEARISQSARRDAIKITERGSLKQLLVRAAVTRLPRTIAERFVRRVEMELRSRRIKKYETEILEPPGPAEGTYVLILAEYENSACCYFGLGRAGRKAEKIAEEMLGDFISFHESSATVDEHLADQLLLPLALCGGRSEFITPRITSHLTTNAEIIRMFLGTEIHIEPRPDGTGAVIVAAKSLPEGLRRP